MKILFFLAVWKRPEITEICFMGLRRLRQFGPALAVISEASMVRLCRKYEIDYVFHDNQPLGKKKNFGLTAAFKYDWDYLIELGSDDLLKNELIEVYKPHFGKSVLSMNKFCYINSTDLDCRITNSGASYGIGRALERTSLEKAARGVEVEATQPLISRGRTTQQGERGFFPLSSAQSMQRAGQCKIVGEECYKIWGDDQENCLDNRSMFFLAANGMMERRVGNEPLGIDIKSEVNIWPFHKDLGLPYDLDKCLSGLSDEEKTAIKWLSKKAG